MTDEEYTDNITEELTDEEFDDDKSTEIKTNHAESVVIDESTDEPVTSQKIEKPIIEPKPKKRTISERITDYAHKNDGRFFWTGYLDRKFNRVGLYTLKWSPENDTVYKDYRRVPFNDLPVLGVDGVREEGVIYKEDIKHLSGMKGEYLFDATGLSNFARERELTAIDTDAWRRNNSLSDSFTERWKTLQNAVDPKKWFSLLIVALVGGTVLYGVLVGGA